MTRYTRKTLPRELANLSHWHKADLTGCTDTVRRRFVALSQAIQRYLGFEKIGLFLRSVELTHEQLLRALNRCVSVGPDGHVYGWRALISNTRTSDYRRTAPVCPREILTRGGYAGALQQFWRAHPDLHEQFDRYLLTGRRGASAPEPGIRTHDAHAFFIQLCRELRFTKKQWPFCTESLGRGAVHRYVHSYFDEHYDATVMRQFGEKAQAKSRTGTGWRSRLQASLPYDVVEIDEHKIHLIGSIGIPTPKGIRWLPVRRITLLLAIDRDSETVLAYVVIFRREAKSSDLLKLIALATRPGISRQLPDPDRSYAVGFPAGTISGLDRCGWVILALDNALIHLAFDVIERARRFLGAAINFGPVKHFERRAVVENVFRQLERAGFQRVTSTTGSSPQDPRRQDPEGKAVKFRITVDKVLDLIDATIAAANGRPNSGNFAISGLEYLQSIVNDPDLGFLPPNLPPKLCSQSDLDVMIERGVITGSRKKGDRPRVSLDGAAYTSPKLARRWDLIGQPLRKYINEDNIRYPETRSWHRHGKDATEAECERHTAPHSACFGPVTLHSRCIANTAASP